MDNAIMQKNLERIEKLIVDGQKEILDEVRGNSRRIDGLEGKFDGLEGKFDGLERKFDRLDKKLDKIDKKHDTNAAALYDLLQDTRHDVNRIEHKLDEHMKQPAHV
ncbi:MAG: hypothetical protein ABIE84_02270 [bacterium]